MQFKIEMTRKVGKEPEGGSKKPKELGNESPLASMFQKRQTAYDVQKARQAYNAILEKGKQLGLQRQRMPSLCAGQNTTHITE